ncbi:MAG: RsmE family RNA methyltransferase [Planctomycetales bacterium]
MSPPVIMTRRFYCPQSFEAPTLTLGGPEAHHIQRVLRLGIGDAVTLFDGRGEEAEARIDAVSPEEIQVTLLSRRRVNLTRPLLTLATAVPKGERFDWLVEKGTELGVDRLIPLITSRSVVHPGNGKLERLRRTIVEACKQCGRSELMELCEPMEWAELLEQEFPEKQVWVADPAGEPVSNVYGPGSGPTLAIVGPEGGLTGAELNGAEQAGARRVSLGSRILRVETAGLVLAALWR